MPESFALTRFLDLLLRGVELRMYHAVGLNPADAAEKARTINSALTVEVVVAAILIAFFIVVRASLSVEKPGAAQHVAEMIHETIGGLADQVIGHGYQRFQAFVTCVFLFIVLTNLSGLIPGINTPTAQPEVPLGIAVLTFLYYNFQGVRANGFGYIKQFLGPIWWIAPLMFLIEVISHLARMMSLTIRLYANMLASDLLTLVGFSMIPMVIPSAALALHFAVSLIQAFVFMLLAMIYLSMAVAHEH
jgi:F-type H+-transporting ATPase subunit a